jgi:hypothetical protein
MDTDKLIEMFREHIINHKDVTIIPNDKGEDGINISLDEIEQVFNDFICKIENKESKDSFDLNEKEQEAANKFQKAIREIYGEYGKFKYIFTPTGIGYGIDIYSDLSDTHKDITDVSNW